MEYVEMESIHLCCGAPLRDPGRKNFRLEHPVKCHMYATRRVRRTRVPFSIHTTKGEEWSALLPP